MKKNTFKVIVVGAAAACAFSVVPWLTGQDRAPGSPLPKMKVDSSEVAREGGFAKSYATIVEKASPSVVSIYTATRAQSFRYYGYRVQQPGQSGLGSGVIISEDGFILTNNHVINGADEIRVSLKEGKEYTAKVIGADPDTDVAVIKIEATELPAITVADSDKVLVGDVVLAIGNPFGLRQTVSMGIISALGRTEVGITNYGNFIQTDATINPGNSGGALVDANGRLVGINTAIFSQTGASVGIGFAIPVNQAIKVVEDLMTEGEVTRGYLGIGMQPVTREIAKALDRDSADGVLISEVGPNTPAESAGLKAYDLVVQCDGERIRDMQSLRVKIAGKNPSDPIKFKIIRDGKEKEVEAILTSQKNPYATEKKSTEGLESVELAAGIYVEELSNQDRQNLRLRAETPGVLIHRVDADAPGKNGRLVKGDIIMEVDRKPVHSVEDVKKLKESSSSERILVRVLGTDGETRLYVLES
jgi:serine protease Do